ncbi:hypothetical protein E2C01_094335 [Portunus trituberculatus]|uniref:Secreted protein n=1 Tax=Portunus trituberculatus TaxID=210409 RepID=A0A5B7JXA7_PORTR|nr:hypothetical protein [Portunus trituberculatus]
MIAVALLVFLARFKNSPSLSSHCLITVFLACLTEIQCLKADASPVDTIAVLVTLVQMPRESSGAALDVKTKPSAPYDY